MYRILDRSEEAGSLLELYGDLGRSREVITRQFDVIQTRTQALIGLATLALTITGFSGPRIAASNPFSRVTMILGLTLVLTALAVALVGALRLRWLTQIADTDARATLAALIAYRDHKTRRFGQALVCLVIGLGFYVSSVIAYLATGLD